MNRRHLIVAASVGASAAALAGCAGVTGALVGLTPGAEAQIHLNAGKALALVVTAADGAANLVEVAIRSGLLTGANEQQAGADLRKLQGVIEQAKAAYQANAHTDITSYIATAADLVAAVRVLAGK